MKFTINALKLQKALENLQVKGKHLTSGGFSNSNLGTDVYATLEDNTLTLLNGSSLFLVRIQIQVNGDTNGQVSFDSTAIIPYLKSFKEDIIFAVGDYVSITCGYDWKEPSEKEINTDDKIAKMVEETKKHSEGSEPTAEKLVEEVKKEAPKPLC